MLARLGNAFKAFSMARKNLHTKFFLEFNNGLGHAWLRSVKGACRFGEIQVASYGLLYKTKLMKIHI